jgi:hypothetical protein
MRKGEYFAKSIASMSKNYNEGLISTEIADYYWRYSDHYPFYEANYPAITAYEPKNISNPYFHTGSDLSTAAGYNYTNGIALAKATLLAIADWANAYEIGEEFDFHYYQPVIDSSQTFDFIVPSDFYSSDIRFTCEESSFCELQIVHVSTSEVFSLNSVNHSNWNIINISAGSYRLLSDDNIEVELILGTDSEKDEIIDYVAELLIDYYFDPIDLQISVVPSPFRRTTTISSSVSTESQVTTFTSYTIYSSSESSASTGFDLTIFIFLLLSFKYSYLRRRKNSK